MISHYVDLTSVEGVKQFVRIVSTIPGDVTLNSGRFVIDAKSILGIFSLDVTRPIRMDIFTDDCREQLEALAPFFIEGPQEAG